MMVHVMRCCSWPCTHISQCQADMVSLSACTLDLEAAPSDPPWAAVRSVRILHSMMLPNHAQHCCTPCMHCLHECTASTYPIVHPMCPSSLHSVSALHSYSAFMQSPHAIQPCRPWIHSIHALNPCTPMYALHHAVRSYHARPSCTPIMHSHYTLQVMQKSITIMVHGALCG